MAPRYLLREHLSQEDVDALYVGFPHLFSIKLLHGGRFTRFPGRSYVEGSEVFIDMLDVDKFSFHELDQIMEKLCYPKEVERYYHYLVPGSDLDFGLRALGSDADVLGFIKYASLCIIVNVYTKYAITTVHIYFCSPTKIVLEEITDEDIMVMDMGNKVKSRLLLPWNENETGEGSGQHNVDHLENDNVDQGENDHVEHVQHVEANQGNLEYGGNEGNLQDVDQQVQLDISLDDPFFDPFFGEGVYEDNLHNEMENEMDGNGNDNVDEDNEHGNDNDEDGNDNEDGKDNEEDNEDGNDNEDEDDSDDSDFIPPQANVNDEDDSDVGEIDNEHFDEMDVGEIDNEQFYSGSESDDNGSSRRKRTLKKMMKSNKNNTNSPFAIGQVFGTKMEVKVLVNEHAVATRRQIKIQKDEGDRVRAVCVGTCPTFEPNEDGVGSSNTAKGKGPIQKKAKNGVGSSNTAKGKKKSPDENKCPWALLVSLDSRSKSWVVRTYHTEHKCLQSREVRACTTTFLSKKLMEQLQENPDIPAKAVQEQFQRQYEVRVSEMKAYRAKRKALLKLHGDYNAQYGNLRDYLTELMNTNPGTTVHIEVERAADPDSVERRFQRVYVCLGPLKQGFKAICRDFLGLDGAFIKGPYTGQVLTAVGVDPNNGIYPLAYAIVEAENTKSWIWFLECIRSDLDLVSTSNFTFIIDRQKGLLPALGKVFPNAEHRYCLRHISENMELRFKGKVYTDMLWKIATSTTVVYFEKEMEALKKFNTKAHNWLSNIPVKSWSRAHFSGRAVSDMLLNNMCEVFNAKIVGGRDKSIITLLEYIREYLMKRIVTVMKVIDRTEGLLTPYATKIFEANKKSASRYKIIWNGEDHYQATGPSGNQWVVNMRQLTCACRQWEITGIPCRHAIAALWNKSANGQRVGIPESFVNPIYRMERWKHVYSFKIIPINGRSMWPKCQVPSVLIPPTHHNPVGRPRKARRKSVVELEDLSQGGKLSKQGKRGLRGKCKNP